MSDIQPFEVHWSVPKTGKPTASAQPMPNRHLDTRTQMDVDRALTILRELPEDEAIKKLTLQERTALTVANLGPARSHVQLDWDALEAKDPSHFILDNRGNRHFY